MTHVGYLVAGWGIAFGASGLFAWSVMQRAKRVALRVPVERQRWLTGQDADTIGET